LERNSQKELHADQPHYESMVRIYNFIISSPNIHEHAVPKLARKFNRTETVIKKNFQSLFKTAISDFVRYHALVKAVLLLSTTQRSVEDIAEEIGYSSRKALERAFKKQFNYSPSAARSEGL
jgi:AraC-like DNA-binding protein